MASNRCTSAYILARSPIYSVALVPNKHIPALFRHSHSPKAGYTHVASPAKINLSFNGGHGPSAQAYLHWATLLNSTSHEQEAGTNNGTLYKVYENVHIYSRAGALIAVVDDLD